MNEFYLSHYEDDLANIAEDIKAQRCNADTRELKKQLVAQLKLSRDLLKKFHKEVKCNGNGF
jgi:hypothetical protein